MEQKPIFEIAVRKVKDGRKFDFVTERSKFVKTLKAQDGVSNDREFQSFYALPGPDEREVFIGMTQYESMEVLNKVQQNIYLLDFQKLSGNAFTFMNLCARIITELKALSASSKGPSLTTTGLGGDPGRALGSRLSDFGINSAPQ